MTADNQDTLNEISRKFQTGENSTLNIAQKTETQNPKQNNTNSLVFSGFSSEADFIRTYEQLHNAYRGQISPSKLNSLHWFETGSLVDKRYKTHIFDPPGMSPRGVQKVPSIYKGVFEKEKGIWSRNHKELNKYGLTNEYIGYQKNENDYEPQVKLEPKVY